MAKKRPDEKQPSFEQMMSRLEEITAELESGELPLEQAIERYEEGVTCYKECHRILAGAEKKVEILTKSADGTLEAEPFEEESAEASEEESKEKEEKDNDHKEGTLPF